MKDQYFVTKMKIFCVYMSHIKDVQVEKMELTRLGSGDILLIKKRVSLN